MLDFNLIGVAVSKDAARYTLFLVEKIASAPSAKYFSLLDTLHRQWQPELFQGTLPEAAVITSSLDEIGWRKTSIEEPKDIEALLYGGEALHQRYGHLSKNSFLQGARIVVAPGLLDGWYAHIAAILAVATQKSLPESRRILDDCKGKIQERMVSLEEAEEFYA
ncbi:MAG: hypothetical protein QT02_C0002G0058 [archaeon GW2011_AR9]|nr:MAG: hypothetical protein QT02_C0002G0058 [archaeon GW2011_AR9]MBS3120602.1 hypothetical protein [Candidatus Woesearchaeota archaeon]HIG93016.1 hypothetical protein [Candidatus Woesearchaeota archaeon]HIH12488.1 hypothetical protein [Candidatus Woesearchaeota archaeon]